MSLAGRAIIGRQQIKFEGIGFADVINLRLFFLIELINISAILRYLRKIFGFKRFEASDNAVGFNEFVV